MRTASVDMNPTSPAVHNSNVDGKLNKFGRLPMNSGWAIFTKESRALNNEKADVTNEDCAPGGDCSDVLPIGSTLWRPRWSQTVFMLYRMLLIQFAEVDGDKIRNASSWRNTNAVMTLPTLVFGVRL